jgi:hypothetical protein
MLVLYSPPPPEWEVRTGLNSVRTDQTDGAHQLDGGATESAGARPKANKKRKLT